jgi:hypothetical protein
MMNEPNEKERKNKMMASIIKNKEKRAPFQLFFLKDAQNQVNDSVEVNEIDFEEMKKRLENGESVYITSKRGQKPNVKFIAYQREKEPWYFLRS